MHQPAATPGYSPYTHQYPHICRLGWVLFRGGEGSPLQLSMLMLHSHVVSCSFTSCPRAKGCVQAAPLWEVCVCVKRMCCCCLVHQTLSPTITEVSTLQKKLSDQEQHYEAKLMELQVPVVCGDVCGGVVCGGVCGVVCGGVVVLCVVVLCVVLCVVVCV